MNWLTKKSACDNFFLCIWEKNRERSLHTFAVWVQALYFRLEPQMATALVSWPTVRVLLGTKYRDIKLEHKVSTPHCTQSTRTIDHHAHRSREGIKYQQKKMTTKETFYFRQLLIFARLSLLYTMSQAHKVVHVSVSPPFVQHAASFLSSHSICYWYFFSKMGNFGTGCMVTQNGLFVPFFLVVKNKGFKGWRKTF